MVDAPLERTVVVSTVQMDHPDVARNLDRYRSLLSADERARERRFVLAGDRERFVVARALARLQLSRFGSLGPREWTFTLNDYGRPEVGNIPQGDRRLRFNISHTRGLVACAITGDREVGVDVEFIDRALAYDVADRFFAPQEVSSLRTLGGEDQDRVFFDYWTLKEAYIKARGLGLAVPLRHFAFTLPETGPATIAFDEEIADDPASWQFVQTRPTRQHRLALAVRRTGTDLAVTFEDSIPTVPA